MSARAPGEPPTRARPADPPQRMPRDRFRELVAEAIDTLPREIRRRMENVAVVVEDQADAETMRSLGLDPEQDELYGLYQGVPIAERSTHYSALPDRIAIYYLPLTDRFHDDYHLRREIRRTVVHEVGHFFGLSDRRLREMGY